MSDWQPIETAPRDGTEILVFGKWDGEVNDFTPIPADAGVARWTGGAWCAVWTDCYSVTCNATHWMPLPPPPKTEPET